MNDDVRYYRGRDLGREMVFDFQSLVQTTSREDLERYFVACVAELTALPVKIANDEIILKFFNDTLSKIRAGRPLVSARYLKT